MHLIYPQMALKMTNNGTFFNKHLPQPFYCKRKWRKEKERGWRWEGKKVGFSGHKGRGGEGPPAAHREAGGDERFPMLPGKGQSIQVLYRRASHYASVPHSWHCLVQVSYRPSTLCLIGDSALVVGTRHDFLFSICLLIWSKRPDFPLRSYLSPTSMSDPFW